MSLTPVYDMLHLQSYLWSAYTHTSTIVLNFMITLNLPNKMRKETSICSLLSTILIFKTDYYKYKCNDMMLQGSVICSDCFPTR